MKLNFDICIIHCSANGGTNPWEKSYGLQRQIGVMISDSFGFKKTKCCRQHAVLVLRLMLLSSVPL